MKSIRLGMGVGCCRPYDFAADAGYNTRAIKWVAHAPQSCTFFTRGGV